MEWQFHQESLIKAIESVVEKDRFLWDVSVNERSLTHKLGCYLTNRYPYYHVDCEYNRKGEITKYLDEDRIFPDVIVHHRGSDEQNRLVIEAKKISGQEPYRDWSKLEMLTGRGFGYEYDFGVHVTFEVFPAVTFRVFQNGEVSIQLSEQIQNAWNLKLESYE